MSSFYNIHSHIFTFENVPDNFLKNAPFGWMGKISVHRLRTGPLFRMILKVLRWIGRSDRDVLDRLANFIEYGQGDNPGSVKISQKDIFKDLREAYPHHTRFIVLSMDMKYMDGGTIPEDYSQQTQALEALQKDFPDRLFPFIFADPRRIKDGGDAFGGKAYLSYFEEKLAAGVFKGIKLYPALGYWPFDRDMRGYYDFALAHQVPLITHCSGGPVYFRGKKRDLNHPVFPEIPLPGKKNRDFADHYTHPLNFHMLMSRDILRTYWGEDAPDYGGLKICFAHFGGMECWPEKAPEFSGECPSLKRENWTYGKDSAKGTGSWFRVVCDLMLSYENIYADISSTLHDRKMFPVLKTLLESNEKLRSRVLFGTDFYMVALEKTEEELLGDTKKYLGQALFEQIAVTNVERFLFGS